MVFRIRSMSWRVSSQCDATRPSRSPEGRPFNALSRVVCIGLSILCAATSRTVSPQPTTWPVMRNAVTFLPLKGRRWTRCALPLPPLATARENAAIATPPYFEADVSASKSRWSDNRGNGAIDAEGHGFDMIGMLARFAQAVDSHGITRVDATRRPRRSPVRPQPGPGAAVPALRPAA